MNEKNVKTQKKSNKLKAIVFGLIAITAGILLIYNNMGLLDPQIKRILFSWQMILIIAGFINIFSRSSRLFGFIMMSVGGFFILPKMMDLPAGFTSTFWPLLIIIAGILIIFFNVTKCRKIGHSKQSSSDDVIDDSFIFGGGERTITSDNFSGGKTVNVFGGSTYDLTRCVLKKGINELEVTCVFGGTKVIVPSTWNIRIEVSSVLGAFEDKRKFINDPIETDKTLIIKGNAILGGGEIVSH